MLKRIFALFLAALMAILAVSCGNKDGAPDDMVSSTVEGEPFILYVPKEWVVNYKSGISSAYYIANKTVMVSARYETVPDTSVTVDKYLESCAVKYSSAHEGFAIVSTSPAVLGGKDARNMKYTMVNDKGVSLTCRQVCARHGEDMISLNFYCETDLFEANDTQFDRILGAFVLRDKQVINDEVVDKNTPEGMKIASEDHIEYRLYVPKSWICHSESGRSEAYYPESGKPNVTVTNYSDTAATTPAQYYAEVEEIYKKQIQGYELLSVSEERKVGGRTALSYTFKAVYDGVEVRVMQTVLVYNQHAYSITYTALADSFDTHMNDVNRILDSFSFR